MIAFLTRKLPFVLLVALVFVVNISMGSSKTGLESIPKDPPPTIEMEYSWVGYSPLRFRQQFELSRAASGSDMYVSNGSMVQIPFMPRGPESMREVKSFVKRLDVAEEKVTNLLKTLHKASWEPTQIPGEVIDHTDDYPNLQLHFIQKDNSRFKLVSTSNTANHAPWNLYIGDELYVTSDEAFSNAVMDLYQAVNPKEPDWQESALPESLKSH